MNPSEDEDTEASQQLLEKCQCEQRSTKTTRLYQILPLLLNAILLAVVLALTLHNDHAENTGLQEEINGLIPDFPTLPQKFIGSNNQYSFTPNSTIEERQQIRRNWYKLIPKGRGFIHIDNNLNDLILPPSIKSMVGGPDQYSIAVFHELHCLRMIYESFESLYFHEEHSGHDVVHTLHCFDYLRQVLQCTGDTTLEGSDDNIGNFGTQGIGSTHVCKDFEAIFAFAEKERLFDDDVEEFLVVEGSSHSS